MPLASPRPCVHPGCPEVQRERRCQAHAKEYAAKRQADSACYSSPRWRAASAAYLAQHPSCVECARRSPPVFRKARHVDHIRPHRGDPALFWNTANWQSLCDSCHGAKTASRDGGFGNRSDAER